LLAQGAEVGKAKATHKGSAKKAVVWPAAGLKWEPAAGAPPGVMEVTLWGDPTKGAFAPSRSSRPVSPRRSTRIRRI
jgi:hypothetical protein